MSDLGVHIREHIDTTVPPVDVDAIVADLIEADASSRLGSRNRAGPGWWRRPWVSFATGVAATVVVVGIALLLRGPSVEPEVEESATSPQTAPTTVPDVSTTVPPATTVTTRPESVQEPTAASWRIRRVDGIEAMPYAVAAGPSGFVATGWEFGDHQRRGVVWHSTDGAAWSRVAQFDDGYLSSGVLSDGAGVVVWGENQAQGGTFAWHSSDGDGGNLVQSGESPLDGESATGGLALDSGGYLLYGGETRVFLSPDGLSWERFDTPVEFTAVVQTESGDLLASGGRISDPTIWISVDRGRTWALHGADHSIDDGVSAEVRVMIDTPFGIVAAGVDSESVAVGSTSARVPVMWISEDGRTFTETARLPIGSDRWQTIEALAVGDGQVFAVGYGEYFTGDSSRLVPVVWTSGDGREWREEDPASLYGGVGGALYGIAYRDGVLVAVGGDHTAAVLSGNGLVLRRETGGG
jgi:hypothetical protein